MTEAREKAVMDVIETVSGLHAVPEDARRIVKLLLDKGLALVPVEPTDRMWLAGEGEFLHSVNSIWRAMLKAAQGGTGE
jgi:hypothetical protein